MLMPKRVKYRRVHRGRMTGKATRGNVVSQGEFGLMATEPGWITSNQIEAARIALTRFTRAAASVFIKIFPDKPVTEKPAETRMGSGKGAPADTGWRWSSPAAFCLRLAHRRRPRGHAPCHAQAARQVQVCQAGRPASGG